MEKTNWHLLEWDQAKIKRFWDFTACWEPWKDDYFSKQVGAGIVNFLRYIVPLEGRTLDYGCGPGYLVDHLVSAGIHCEAVDSSAETIAVVNQRFAGNPLWGGAHLFDGGELPYPDDTFDLIICLETIEHVLPAHMDPMLRELQRILKPKTGKLFITTPHAENLAKNSIYCAECGAVSHRYQHVSSFTCSSLESLFANHGFRTVICDVTVFNYFQQPLFPTLLDWSPRVVLSLLKYASAGILDRLGLLGSPFGGYRFQQRIGSWGHHLFWLGEKE